ncbi:hypothetical protein SDJN03_13161, partial [Cucurbita argyrosperma subsp. sororia]
MGKEDEVRGSRVDLDRVSNRRSNTAAIWIDWTMVWSTKVVKSFEDARNNDSARVSSSERRLPSDTNSNASRRGHIAGELHPNSVPILPSLPYSASTDPSLLRILLSDSESERQNLPRLIPHHIDIRPSALRRLHQPRRDTELLERKMLELLPPEHNDDLGDIDFTNCVSIHLRDFRRIVHQELSVSYRDRVCITTSESQIKLSVGDKKTILTREVRENLV